MLELLVNSVGLPVAIGLLVILFTIDSKLDLEPDSKGELHHLQKSLPILQNYLKCCSSPFESGSESGINVSYDILLIYLSRRQKKNEILLIGICESGKTALFSKLVYGGMNETYASIKENVGDYQTSGKQPRKLKLVDLPGHEKLRHQFLKHYKAKAGGIVYVVDSQAIQRELKDVAEFLYTFLTDTSVLKSRVRILIACNKQDHTMAKGSKVVRGLLEKELNTLRVTRGGALEGLDVADGKNTSPLGRPGKEFQFTDLRVPVDFVECSVRENLDPVKIWLDKL